MNETNRGKKRICFIINPISGRRKNRNIEELINLIIDSTKYQVTVKYTEAEGHARNLCRLAIENKTEIIVAVGGDGTINEVASEMVHTNGILGIIPSGSGNGLARHLGIPINNRKALELINKGHITSIDTAKVNEKRFISIAGIGFDAFVAKEFAENKRRGFITYFSIVAEKFLQFKQRKYTLVFDDGTTISQKALFIAFANSNQFGYNTQIAPNAMLNDGKLDICIVKKPPLTEMPNIVNLLLLKKIDRSRYVKVIKSSSVSVKREFDREINLDGEAVNISKDFDVKVDPLSLKIIIPKNG
jgi:YegS/Rv2252/BmrU family lipid kinase